MTTRKFIVQNGIYHVTQRAPGKEILFVEDNDYLKFLRILKTLTKEFNLEIYCFALLPNHLHLLLKIKEKNLDRAMKYLFQRYALWFNKKYERKGHVFCGSYRAAFCQDNDYLITISLYIHLNPFKAGLTKKIFDYKWSSINCYVRSISNSFVHAKEILNIVEGRGNRHLVYKDLIEDIRDVKVESVLENKHAVNNFAGKLIERLTKISKKYPSRNKLTEALLRENDVIQDMSKRGRRVRFADKKAFLYCVQQLRLRGFTYEEIANKLHVNRVTIYRLMQQKC